MENAQPRKRPVGMTILLVMSFINACWNILTGMVSFLVLPGIASTYESGQMEETMGPFYGAMSDEMKQMMMDGVRIFSQIDPKYWIFLTLLFIGSLVGVIQMFRGKKVGLHIYAIAQILMLINASVYLYPLQPQSGFVSDLLLTLIFILLYYLYFKRMEMLDNPPHSPEEP